jgi:Ca-activated chloride channel homolog
MLSKSIRIIAFTTLMLFVIVSSIISSRAVKLQDSQEVDDGETISVRTTEVILPVTVRDSTGRLVTNLTRKDFRIWEEGREQKLSDLVFQKVPVDVLLMIDSSSSVAPYFDDFRKAADEFASWLSPEDRIGLLKFDDKVELLQDWTTQRTQLRRSLRRLTPGIFTKFNDALYLASREQFKQDRRRHAIVVLTDGIDSGRGYATREKALQALLEAQVSVYTISNIRMERARKESELQALLDDSPSLVKTNALRIGDLREGLRVLDLSEQNLEDLASSTGGRVYKPDNFNTLDRVYTEVAEELRHQYALYYTPENKTRDGRFRRVRVDTVNPSLKISSRIGYYAPRS